MDLPFPMKVEARRLAALHRLAWTVRKHEDAPTQWEPVEGTRIRVPLDWACPHTFWAYRDSRTRCWYVVEEQSGLAAASVYRRRSQAVRAASNSMNLAGEARVMAAIAAGVAQRPGPRPTPDDWREL